MKARLGTCISMARELRLRLTEGMWGLAGSGSPACLGGLAILSPPAAMPTARKGHMATNRSHQQAPIPVAVRKLTQACNQAGPGPSVPSAESVTLSVLVPSLWALCLCRQEGHTGACLLLGTLDTDPSILASWPLGPAPWRLLPVLTSCPLPHQSQMVLAPPHWLNSAFLLPKGPLRGLLPGPLTCR